MKLIKKFEICGIQYRVVKASEEEAPDLAGNFACCDIRAATIYISDEMAAVHDGDNLFHETFHAILFHTGLAEKLGKISPELEEEIVTLVTPLMRTALKSAGWKEPKT
jgi:hypothetical protein